jgi:glutamate/tyrosine decarboxylase-like PLP-dependent enzyme
LWLPLQVFGVAPFRAALEEKVLLCRYAWEHLQTMGFETGPFPDLSICIFRYVPPSGDPDAFNEALLHYVQQDGRSYLSSTRISGAFWIRFAVLSFRTHRREVDQALDILREGLAVLL